MRVVFILYVSIHADTFSLPLLIYVSQEICKHSTEKVMPYDINRDYRAKMLNNNLSKYFPMLVRY